MMLKRDDELRVLKGFSIRSNTCVLLLLWTGSCLAAEESEELSDTPWWSVTQNQASRYVSRWANGLDAFFSGESQGRINQSFVSVRSGVVLGKDQASPFFDLQTGIKLPNTADRLRLVIESDGDQLTTDNQQQQPASQDLNEVAANTSLAAALRVVKEEWNADLDVGVLVDFPLDPYVRTRFAQDEQLGGWRFSQRESVFSYYSKGFGIQLGAGAAHSISEFHEFGINLSGTWLKQGDDYFFRQDVFVNSSLSDRLKLRTQFSVLESEYPDPQVDSYLYLVRVERLLYQNWLIGQMTPQVTHSDENDFNPSFSLTLSLQALLGEEYLSRQ